MLLLLYIITHHLMLVLTKSYQLSTASCEKNTLCRTSILILRIKNDNDNLSKNVLIYNHIVPTMPRAHGNNNDSNNDTITTVLQSVLNFSVVKFTKSIMSSLLA